MSDIIIEIWYGNRQRFGQNGCPSRYINIPGRVSSPAGVQAAGYQLNDGPFRVLPLGPTAFRLLGPGDFNVEIDRKDLKPGENLLNIVASDMAGNKINEEAVLELTADKTWPLPCSVDWSSADTINDIAQVIDGKWELTPDGLHCAEIGYDRLVSMGEVSWTDYDVTVPFKIHRFSDIPGAYAWPSHGSGFGPLIRWQGHTDWGDIKPNRGYLPHGCIGFYLWREPEKKHRWLLYSGSDGSILAKDPELDIMELNRWYQVRMAVESQTDKPGKYRLKYWAADQEEPDGWLLEAENGPDELKAGSLVLVAHHTEVTFGNVEIR